MSSNRQFDKYNFILSVIGFIGSIGFYLGVLAKVYEQDPEKQLIEQLKKENEFLKHKLEQSKSISMINRSNYFRIMQNVRIESLPKELQDQANEVDDLTESGESWNFYTTPRIDYKKRFPFKEELDTYFKQLYKYLKKNDPDSLNISGRPKKMSNGIYDKTSGDDRPSYLINSIRTGLYFLRRSIEIHNTFQSRKNLLIFLNELQLALVMRQINADEFQEPIDSIQNDLINEIYELDVEDSEPHKFSFRPGILAKIKAAIRNNQNLTSLAPRNIKPNKTDPELLIVIKKFHQHQGMVVTHGFVRKLRDVFEKSLYKINYPERKSDPYYHHYKFRLQILENFNANVRTNKSILASCKVYIDFRNLFDETQPKLLRSLYSNESVGSLNRDNSSNFKNEQQYIDIADENLSLSKKVNRPQMEKIANGLGISDKTVIKELTEYSIVKHGREIALGTGTIEEKFQKIVNLYNHQTNISFRTSQSILLKQYSTPAPIGYLMGIYCELDSGTKRAFEPSAGNGLLTIASHPKMVTVNEIDRNRRNNLYRDSYAEILNRDASEPFGEYHEYFDAVITNPPFGRIGKERKIFVNGYRIYDLDHHMAIIALDTMKYDGKAAIIVGGHLQFDSLGRIVAGKDRIFYNYLYSHYNVEDVIPIDGRKLYSRQGTGFDTSLILINGRKTHKVGVAPLYNERRDTVVKSFDQLFERIMNHSRKIPTNEELKKRALELYAKLKGGTLEGPYTPSSTGRSLETQVPDSMDFELHASLKQITEDVGGDMDNFVRHRMGYPSKQALHEVLGAEQIDAVGMAIYNIEALGQGIIVGDQTGIGKGRIAASMIRYSCLQGIKPIFITVGVNLFSDIYRDLDAIGSAHLVPFIVNAREGKTDVKDEDGLVIHQAPSSIEQARVFESGDLSGYDFVLATYSQFSSPEKKETKPKFLKTIAQDSIIIMDESHIASGSSNTGQLMQSVVRSTKGAVFLSATFAKRPDNMPIYALKTAISEANMSRQELVRAITSGGVALQEILSAQLVAEGQMVRRERSYEGIEVNYITLDKLAQEHSAIADNITSILRDIIRFQNVYVDQIVSELDEQMAEEGSEVRQRNGTQNAGVDNTPYFSKVFNVINQMLFSIKAEAVADRAIDRLKEGKKPVIAFSSTLGSFLEQMQDEEGLPASVGDTINADFAIILEKGLEGVLKYTVTEPDGKKVFMQFDPLELGAAAKEEYDRIRMNIKTITSGITISPIDVIIQRIESAGYSVGEVTGRKLKLKLNGRKGTIENRKRYNTNDVFRRFNNNEIDVLMINQSGSTGASAHAIPTNKVPVSDVKQRVMIVLQPELDINTEIQKRGRINRTGQIKMPIYDYLNSAIPAEKRLMMMLQKKLKSLDANTSSNQKQSSSILSVPDFLNKYGDSIIVAYLKENPEMNDILGDPVNISAASLIRSEKKEEAIQKEDAASKVSGRIAVLSTKMQEEFYNEISDRYENLVNYLKQTGDYDLEVESMDLKAKTLNIRVIKMGRGGNSSFGEDTFLETVEANVLKKPFKAEEVKSIVQQSLGGKSPEEYQRELLEKLSEYSERTMSDSINKIIDLHKQLRTNIENDPKIKKVKKTNPEGVQDAIFERLEEIDNQESTKIDQKREQLERRFKHVEDLFRFFTVGKRLIYPEEVSEGASAHYMAVFLGFKLELKHRNPFAPSAIGLRFAIASSQKSIEIPASYGTELNAIKGASYSVHDQGLDHTLYEWGDEIYNNNKDRIIRFIITGNILQSFSSRKKGKLVSYTTNDGQVRKGILLPESIDLDKEFGDDILIPISKTINLFKSLVQGKQIEASHGISFFKVHDNMYRMIVSGSMKDGGEVFLNQKVIALTFNENFERIGTNMTAYIEISDLEEMLNVLEDEIGVSVKMTEQQVKNMGLVDRPVKPRKKIEPPSQEETQTDQTSRFRQRALALEIELKLLARKNKAS